MRKSRVLLFAGTTEGRKLGEALSAAGVDTLLCVATPYGESLVHASGSLRVHTGRLDSTGMAALLRREDCGLAVDATHPYAREVSRNIRAACREAEVECLRLERGREEYREVAWAADAGEAAGILAREGGKALLTVGSKELKAFTAVPDYQNRLYARVLPMAGVVEACGALGFSGRQLICMQGPFSHALNEAMLRELRVDWMVTKDSGKTGGVGEKLSAARAAGVRALVIRRPEEVCGYSCTQLREELENRLGITLAEEPETNILPAPRFPLFVSLQDKRVAVIGGGAVALRRVETLLQCGAAVQVTAPAIQPGLEMLERQGRLLWERREYRHGDLEGMALAAACTDDPDVNARVGEDARKLRIPCSVAHDRRLGSFWFPALAVGGNLVAGLVSTNGDHSGVRRAAGILRKNLGGQE